MKQNLTLKQKVVMAIVGLLLAGAGWLMGLVTPKPAMGANTQSNFAGEPVDLVGSRTGTTTTSVSFGVRTASSTYVTLLGADKDNLALYLESLASSTAPTGRVDFSLLGSNDSQCNTASTTGGTLNPIITSDIHWYDLAGNVKDSVGLTGLASATTTFSFTTDGTTKGRTLVLKDVDAKCFAFEVAASSTQLHVSYMARGQRIQ